MFFLSLLLACGGSEPLDLPTPPPEWPTQNAEVAPLATENAPKGGEKPETVEKKTDAGDEVPAAKAKTESLEKAKAKAKEAAPTETEVKTPAADSSSAPSH